jgi:hypothetical protein
MGWAKRDSWSGWLGLWCSSVLAVGMAGCSEPREELVRVEGKVRVGNQPLTTGTVIFVPDATRGNRSKEEPRGEIDPEGRYRLFTGAREGVQPGWYKVAVTAAEQLNPNNPYFTKWLIPEKYIDTRTSNLALQVLKNAPSGAYDLQLDPR